jgi:hypothetical protein
MGLTPAEHKRRFETVWIGDDDFRPGGAPAGARAAAPESVPPQV